VCADFGPSVCGLTVSSFSTAYGHDGRTRAWDQHRRRNLKKTSRRLIRLFQCREPSTRQIVVSTGFAIRRRYPTAVQRHLVGDVVHRISSYQFGRSTLFQMDCFEWLRSQSRNSIHAVLTDPPYGLVEYSPNEQKKLRSGKGGLWRIPPSFDGTKRSPLPRFTVLSPNVLVYVPNARQRRRSQRTHVARPKAELDSCSNLSVPRAGGLLRKRLSRGGKARCSPRQCVATYVSGRGARGKHRGMPGYAGTFSEQSGTGLRHCRSWWSGFCA